MMSVNGKNELERFTDKFGYNEISTALSEWIGRRANELDIDGTEITLDDIDVKFTCNLLTDGGRFSYVAVIVAEIAYTDLYRDSRSISQWFIMNCAAEVDDTFRSFEVSGIEIYSRKPPRKNNATENFVPIISKPQMDDEARKFLRSYFPRALVEPAKVPVREIVAEMGLKLEFGYILSEDFSYLGQIAFSDTKTRVFDLKTGASHSLDVTRGMILVDPEVFWERSLGCENFTVVHEIMHWEKHKLFIDIKRLLYTDRENYKRHCCPKPSSILWDSDDTWSDNEWLEWHANGIGARVLMPRETVPMKVMELQAGYPPELMADSNAFFVQLIADLAEFYGTSRTTTKYRLKELGYKAVEDIQLHEYDYKAFTHEVDEYKAFYEICDNAELRMMVSMGFFTYADSHFVINHEKCVSFDEDGIPHLTEFAWANLEKCTLKFANVRANIRDRNFSDILFRNEAYSIFQKYKLEYNKAAMEFARELATSHTEKTTERVKLRVSLCDRVQQIFEIKGIDSNDFQELTLLSRDTFSKLKKQDYKPAFETIIALCAGLDLDIFITTELLGKAGYSFDGSEKHNAYMAVITQFAGKSIIVRNEFLRKLNVKGVKPLGEKDAE